MSNDPQYRPDAGRVPYSQGYGQVAPPAVPPTNSLAVTSLATAFFVSLVAVITGHIALSQIRRRGEGGRGLAIAGLVIGYLGLAAGIAGAIFAISVAVALRTATTAGQDFAPGDEAVTAPYDGTTSGYLPTGRTGAAHFDDGYLELGTGPVVVDEYIDPMCPYCRDFETTNGALLSGLVGDGSITLRLHSLTFLDEASQGTEYSTRASAALTCVATLDPEGTLDYLAALFASQPAEGTTGLSDAELTALSRGAVDIADCVTLDDYRLWSQVNTDEALNGPIPGAEIDSIDGTPTVLVDGAVYLGSLTDPSEFEAFLGSRVVA
jgi:protein-disulfide isomerase